MVRVRQHYLDCLAQASYSIVSDDQVFFVDPRRDIDEYVSLVEKDGLRPVGVMITHLHADFVAGHRDLAARYQIPVYVGRGAGAEYEHVGIKDGDELTFGRARLVFWETPGHTPGDVSVVVRDTLGAADPIAVLTGDTLFNGDVGRPDLLASFGVTKEELVAKLYTSVQRLMTLPDDTVLYPAHGAGSLCGKSLGAETRSTIGEQRRVNYAVRARSPEEFAALVTTGQETAPKYFVVDAVMNKKGPTNLDALVGRVESIETRELLAILRTPERYHFVDGRDSEAFARAFIPGFVNIGTDGWFASWSGMLLDNSRPVVFIAPEGGEREMIVRLARVGIDNVRGYVKGGFAAIEASGIETASFSHMSALEVRDAVRNGAILVDVRSTNEREANGVIAGAAHLPLPEFASPDAIARVIGPDRVRPVIAHCAGGYRSAAAASILRAAGFGQVSDMAGGFGAWREAGLPVTNTPSEG